MYRKYLWIGLVSIGLMACEKTKKEQLLLGGPIAPSITGTWTGDLTVNGATAHVQMNLVQNNIGVSGTYTASSSQDMSESIATKGNANGATTGPTFSIGLQPSDAACTLTIQAGGENNGQNLSFNVTGNDCTNTSIHGQATLQKS